MRVSALTTCLIDRGPQVAFLRDFNTSTPYRGAKRPEYPNGAPFLMFNAGQSAAAFGKHPLCNFQTFTTLYH